MAVLSSSFIRIGESVEVEDGSFVVGDAIANSGDRHRHNTT